jgi:ABC-type Zn uptake system ZnuABC Zn-binding protein ZnuA
MIVPARRRARPVTMILDIVPTGCLRTTIRPARAHGAGRGRVLLAGLAAAALAVAGLAAETHASPIKIAATIFPVYDIVRQVAGPAAEVVLVLPPGASPHTFEPSPSTVRALDGVRTLFVVGYGLDGWAARLARGAGVTRLVQVDSGIALRRAAEASHGDVDPHYWLSASNAKAIARTVGDELTRLAPDCRAEIEGSLASYLARLDAADAEVRRILADLPARRIATFHDAFGYFADAYGLEVAATFEPYPGVEPSPRFVIEFQEKIRACAVRAVFTEPQLSVDALRPLARDLGVTIAVLDPLGGLPGRESYTDLLLFDARAVAAVARHR